METLGDYLERHGRAEALYSDKHSIFRINLPDHEGELTQFTRALKTLDIEPIHAHTPQAKGRVERANPTLQDRLVKELRLLAISDLDIANAFLPTFIAAHNARFTVPPHNHHNAYRSGTAQPGGSPPIPLDDAKSLHRTIDQAQAKQATRPTWKPAPDHPWKPTIKSTSTPSSLP